MKPAAFILAAAAGLAAGEPVAFSYCPPTPPKVNVTHTPGACAPAPPPPAPRGAKPSLRLGGGRASARTRGPAASRRSPAALPDPAQAPRVECRSASAGG